MVIGTSVNSRFEGLEPVQVELPLKGMKLGLSKVPAYEERRRREKNKGSSELSPFAMRYRCIGVLRYTMAYLQWHDSGQQQQQRSEQRERKRNVECTVHQYPACTLCVGHRTVRTGMQTGRYHE